MFILQLLATIKWTCGKPSTLSHFVWDTSGSQWVIGNIRESLHCRIVALRFNFGFKRKFLLSKFFKLDRTQLFVPSNVCPVIMGGHFKDMPWRVFSPLSMSRGDGRGLKFYYIFSLHSSSRWLHMEVRTADHITRVPSPTRWIPPSGSVMSSAIKASFIFCPHHCFSVCPEQTGAHLHCFSRAMLRAASPHRLVHWDPTGCVSMGHKPIVIKLKSVEWRCSSRWQWHLATHRASNPAASQ